MTKSKRQELPAATAHSGGLWLVATPIGNLGDLSERARRALESAELVLAEDTRVARSLFQGLGLEVRGRDFERCDRFREDSAQALDQWLAAARMGKNVVFVSDAGTPGISDPGSALARYFRDAGEFVHVIPGPSAVTTFLSGAGFESAHFRFLGFFPRTSRDRRQALAREFSKAEFDGVRIWFEAPSRIEDALKEWCAYFEEEGDSAIRLVLAKELTKIHEAWLQGTPQHVLDRFLEETSNDSRFASGEWVFGAERLACADARPASPAAEAPGITQELMKNILDFAAGLPVKSSDLAKSISQAFGLERESAYRELLARRKKDS